MFPLIETRRVSQSQPETEAERRDAITEEFSVRRGPAVALELHAPPPPGSREEERVGQLEPGDEAPADLPATVLHRSPVQRRHEPPAAEPAEPHERPGLAVFAAGVQPTGRPIGRPMG